MKYAYLFILAWLLLLLGCAEQHYRMADFAAVEKIDAHVHVNSPDPAFLDQAIEDNFKLLSINVDYPDFPPLEKQLEIAVKHLNDHPDRFAFASSFRMQGWDEPGWAERTIRHLDSTFAAGAVAVKVWKNIGMDFRDKEGRLVMIDNPRFQPLFDHLRQRNIPLIGHQGEPKNCWLPLEEMTVNNDREYFRNHPQYHMYLHPEFPSYEEQMAARDRMLENNRELAFMGAHLASLEWSVERIARFLDRFPRAVVDMAARMGQVQYQSSREREKVRRFFIQYQDRILYATDLTQEPEANPEEFRQSVHKKWLEDWKYLTSDSLMTVPELDTTFTGLALPKKVIEKIYYLNARRFFPGAWKEE
ncbi:MAG: hypothetical protein Kow0042_00340 [Calditrichia bacterium]